MSITTLQNSARWQNVRTVLSAGAVLVLVYFARAKDLFSDFSRPTVTFALHLLGIGAVDHGDTIAVGRLEVPWTRDCAGLNLLLVIAALTIWVNRTEPAGCRYWLKIALSVPAALLANVLRVLSLIGYREAFYPNVESPQLHYFLGLVWLMPFLAMVVPRGRRPLGQVLLESLQAAAVIALLAPMSGVPGGQTITIAALIGLAHSGVQRDALRRRSILTLAWVFLAAVIALLGMESFWLPWLLLCPLLASRRWVGSLAGGVLTAATHPLFGLIPGGITLAWIAIGWLGWQWLRGSASTSEDSSTVEPREILRPWLLQTPAVAALFLLPFVASTLFAREHRTFLPPANTTYTTLAADAFDVRIAGQPENIGLAWFNPSGNGRHHSMKVCMKYRGVDLEATTACPSVFTDGQRWMREFYLQDGLLVPSYRAYLVRTFRPLSSPGVHLIFFTNCDQMSAGDFNQACLELAACLDEKKATTEPTARLTAL
jgi:exosortase/archaeosortase family protein